MTTTYFRFALLVGASLHLAACASTPGGAPPPAADAAPFDAPDAALDAAPVDAAGAAPVDTLDAALDAAPSTDAADALVPSDASSTDVAASTDAPSTETRAVTFVGDVQPILRTTCNGCHDGDAGTAAPFVESYAVTQRLSVASNSYGCPGELIGACINRAAQEQRLEGTRCRTYDRPFHRDGFNRCITDDEKATIMAWVAGGMIER